MDPLTLLALANGAVAAVKKGCQLYKDIKSAAGDVKGVLQDMEKQFAKQTEGKPPTKEQKQQFEAKKKEVRENLSKDPNDIISVIGDQLGTFFDAMDKIEELFYEEEKKAKEVYTGDVSLSRRALQRVLIRSRLEQMEVELREQMIYHVPAELKDLWTRFQDMRVQIIEEQKVARVIKEKEDAIKAAKRRRRMETLSMEISLVVGVILIFVVMAILFTWIHFDKKKRWPELEQKTYQQELEKERKLRNEKIIEAIRYLDEKNHEQNRKLLTPNEEK
jgi:precorrin isomerase